MRLTRLLAAAGTAAMLALPAGAQDGSGVYDTTMSAGEREYMNACASCHGKEGRGDGPLAGMIEIEVPDLTQIAARNDGVFPVSDIVRLIDGRRSVRGHANPMPVWGDRFKAEAGDRYGPWGSGSTLFVRSRILALTYYLERIQERGG